MFILMIVTHFWLLWSSIEFKNQELYPLTFFFQNYLGFLNSLEIPYEFLDYFLFLQKAKQNIKHCCDFDRNCIESVACLGSVIILTTLSIPIHKRGIPCHLIIFSSDLFGCFRPLFLLHISALCFFSFWDSYVYTGTLSHRSFMLSLFSFFFFFLFLELVFCFSYLQVLLFFLLPTQICYWALVVFLFCFKLL